MAGTIREEQIYRNDQAGVKVFRGRYMGQPVAIKCLKHQSLASANIAVREAMTTMRVQHSYICRVLNCSIEETEEGLETVLVTEWMDGGDLMKDIERRLLTGYWSNEEMRRHMYYLVEALALAQSERVAHRDIKPQNVLCNSQGMVKITDFGSSLFNLEARLTYTLQGSPFYLSPELKRSYVQRKGQIGQVQYDPYRSDVYSLGLTLLHVARLKAPDELMDLETLESDTNRVMAELSYDEDLRYFLGMMLGVANRPDFIELYAVMQQYYCPQAAQEVPAVMVQAQAAQEVSPVVEAFASASRAELPEAYPEMNFTPTCVICCERNSPTKRWRKYMPEKYKDKISLFGLVCRLDCLDELINRSEQVAPVKEEVGGNTCGLCRTHIERRHNVCMLQCNHMICGWQCLVTKLLQQPKTLQCACSFVISPRTRKEILQKCKFPLNTFCLICKQKTDRAAKCRHPICMECTEFVGIPLTQHCVVCAKPPQ